MAISPTRQHRQNVIEIEPAFELNKTLSKIEDEPVMFLKINDLRNDKMSDAMMFMNQKGLAVIHGNLIKMS